MARVAYILLCHRDPSAVVRQARRLVRGGDQVSIHYDGRAPQAEYDLIRAALKDLPDVTFPARRVRCGWGEWSLVAATLAAAEAALSAFPEATHLYLLSGDCMPIKPAAHVRARLAAEDADFIEVNDFYASDWIRTGPREERLVYRHWVNERQRKRLFYASLAAQRKLGLERDPPKDLRIMIGSQWWCLRRRTVEAILGFLKSRPDAIRFFRTTWIPDETFFQTVVAHLVPETEIRSRTLTFLMFTDYGMPVTFYNDHYDFLVCQDCLFARKISSEAAELKDRLGRLYLDDSAEIEVSGNGRRLFDFVTGRGRVGQRFAPRFWEAEASIGRDRELMIVACKKWHVAKRLLDELSHVSNLPALEYVFDEQAARLPDLGGIETTLEKRTRHRRALMRMLYEYYETDRMVICMDPGNLDLLHDFYADRSRTRLLEIECRMSDDYLTGHAKRIGLLPEGAGTGMTAGLLPTIRNDVLAEADRMRDARFPDHHRLHEADPPERAAETLGRFFDLAPDRARAMAGATHIFKD